MSGETVTPFDDVSAGEVVLCIHPTGDRVVDSLPPSAFANLLVLTTHGDLQQLEQVVSAHGDPGQVGVVPITGSSVAYDGPLWTTDRVNPGDLTGVSIQFSEAFKHVRPDDGWVVVDNIGVLSMYVSQERLFRFVDSVANAVRERNARCVLATARGVLGESGLAKFRGLATREVSRD